MSEETIPSIDDFIVTIELSVKQVNEQLNMMNQPFAVPSLKWAEYINLYQQQALPQVKQAQESLETIAKAQDESQAAS